MDRVSAADLRISFPHLGDYHVIFRELLEMFGCTVITPPPTTKRTIELGAKYAPDSVCIPFKYNLGNFLEAIELGANAFCVNATAGCRVAYYLESHQQILRDLGHKVHFIPINEYNPYYDFRKYNRHLSRIAYLNRFWLIIKKLHLLDHLADLMRKRLGFEVNQGSFRGYWQDFMARLPLIRTHSTLRGFARAARAELLQVPIDMPKRPLRVGVIGELFVLIEPFCSFQLEAKLAKMGVEVHRWVTVSSILHHGVDAFRAMPQLLKQASPYVMYHLGAHGTESVARLHNMIKAGFDGAIHVKPFACMPEINALPALHKMCRDLHFPLLSLSFDAHTAEMGVLTRLEAFYDMISFKRQGSLSCKNAI